jgi:hypothetical protein
VFIHLHKRLRESSHDIQSPGRIRC